MNFQAPIEEKVFEGLLLVQGIRDRLPQQTFGQDIRGDLADPRVKGVDDGAAADLPLALPFVGTDRLQGSFDGEEPIAPGHAAGGQRVAGPLRHGERFQGIREFAAQMRLIQEVR